jgi:ABC-type transport system involved in multi-copper enzyme maturation permease subunit
MIYSLQRIGTIIGATLNDELHHKSVYLLGGLAVFFVLMLRGCFDNNVVVNGARLDGATIGWHASLIAFQIIAVAGVMVGILLGMRVLRRDKSTGVTAVMMSKPVTRFEYLIAKIIGVWILAYGLVFILHATVYGIMLVKTGGSIALFMPASLLISINVAFAVVLVMLLSQVLPDIAAAMLGAAVWLVGYINDMVIAASQTAMVKSVLQQVQHGDGAVAIWRIVWPKMTAVQLYAVALIKDTAAYSPGPVHPVFNVAIFLGAALVLLWWHFSREEIR